MQNIIPNSLPPAWAEHSRIDGDGISHNLRVGSVPADVGTLTVSVNRYDLLDVTADGVALTSGPVEVFVGDAKLPLSSVLPLAELLSRVGEVVERA